MIQQVQKFGENHKHSSVHFHGPVVESRFNVMGDLLHAKSSRMHTETYSAMLPVKYRRRSKNTSAIALHGRKDVVECKMGRTLI